MFIPHLGCPYHCSFCDQKAISGQESPVTPETAAACLKEAFQRPLDGENTEIAFFGGSFTCLPKEEMLAFLETAKPYLEQGRAKGIRISTRPDGIDRERLSILRQYGVTAIELGAQSMDDEVLLKNGRGHTAANTMAASALIREYGFSLGLQMMIGLYGDTERSLWETARRLRELCPDTIRLYPVAVLEGTGLAALMANGEYHPLTVEEAVQLTAPLIPFFEEKGVRVIRVGLHASRELERSLLGGGYHPAFRELCESELFLREILKKARFLSGKRLRLTLSPREVSKAVGQKRGNLRKLSQMGYTLTVTQDPSLSVGEWRLTEEKGER